MPYSTQHEVVFTGDGERTEFSTRRPDDVYVGIAKLFFNEDWQYVSGKVVFNLPPPDGYKVRFVSNR